MKYSFRHHLAAGGLAATLGLSVCGCTSATHRNASDSILMTASPTSTEDHVTCVLELKDRREEFKLSESDAFLSSERAAKLGSRMKSDILRRREALRRTMTGAQIDLEDGIAICALDAQKPVSNDNAVIYVAGRPGIRILFSCDEVGELLALNEIGEDLATIRYTHPDFDPERLRALRDQLAALDLSVRNSTFSAAELDQKKTAAAARIIERDLRERGIALPHDQALLTSGFLAATSSPKLTAALQDRAVVERILAANDPDLTRALIRLSRLHVVELSYP